MVVCIEARHAKAAMVAMNRNKNDRNDAHSIAYLIRSGWFKAVGFSAGLQRASADRKQIMTPRSVDRPLEIDTEAPTTEEVSRNAAIGKQPTIK